VLPDCPPADPLEDPLTEVAVSPGKYAEHEVIPPLTVLPEIPPLADPEAPVPAVVEPDADPEEGV